MTEKVTLEALAAAAEKYFLVLEDAIAYAQRHALYPDHPDLTTADYALRQLRRLVSSL